MGRDSVLNGIFLKENAATKSAEKYPLRVNLSASAETLNTSHDSFDAKMNHYHDTAGLHLCPESVAEFLVWPQSRWTNIENIATARHSSGKPRVL